jgi:hypothetical protein
MSKIKNFVLNNALAMFLALQILLSALGFILGLCVPAKRKTIAFLPAFVIFCAGAVELAAYTLKRLRE